MDSEVTVVESSFVAPGEPTPRKGLWLSSLDLLMLNKGHTPTYYLFHRPDDVTASDFFDVARLKEAMAKALVAFYPPRWPPRRRWQRQGRDRLQR
jgi:shikimate O-hydroxycinnamoyltransferase